MSHSEFEQIVSKLRQKVSDVIDHDEEQHYRQQQVSHSQSSSAAHSPSQDTHLRFADNFNHVEPRMRPQPAVTTAVRQRSPLKSVGAARNQRKRTASALSPPTKPQSRRVSGEMQDDDEPEPSSRLVDQRAAKRRRPMLQEHLMPIKAATSTGQSILATLGRSDLSGLHGGGLIRPLIGTQKLRISPGYAAQMTSSNMMKQPIIAPINYAQQNDLIQGNNASSTQASRPLSKAKFKVDPSFESAVGIGPMQIKVTEAAPPKPSLPFADSHEESKYAAPKESAKMNGSKFNVVKRDAIKSSTRMSVGGTAEITDVNDHSELYDDAPPQNGKRRRVDDDEPAPAAHRNGFKMPTAASEEATKKASPAITATAVPFNFSFGADNPLVKSASTSNAASNSVAKLMAPTKSPVSAAATTDEEPVCHDCGFSLEDVDHSSCDPPAAAETAAAASSKSPAKVVAASTQPAFSFGSNAPSASKSAAAPFVFAMPKSSPVKTPAIAAAPAPTEQKGKECPVCGMDWEDADHTSCQEDEPTQSPVKPAVTASSAAPASFGFNFTAPKAASPPASQLASAPAPPVPSFNFDAHAAAVTAAQPASSDAFAFSLNPPVEASPDKPAAVVAPAAPAASTGFTFGTPAASAATAAPTSTSFTFGAANTAAAKPDASVATPAPPFHIGSNTAAPEIAPASAPSQPGASSSSGPASGFTFGSSSTSSNAAPAAASAPNFSFGSASNAPAAAAPTGFSFGSNPADANAASASNAASKPFIFRRICQPARSICNFCIWIAIG